jgi:D-3-phosphoglycerate dehydrogenase
MTTKIFVALSTFAEHGDEPLKALQESGFPFFINPLGRRLVRDEIVEMGRTCLGVVAGVEPYDEDVLERMPELRCISRCGVGIDNIDLEAARRRGIAVLNTPDVVVQPVAELTVAMIFDLLKKLSFLTSRMKAGHWEKSTGQLLAGRSAGVLGLGRIGRRVAEILAKLDCRVSGSDLSPDREWARRAGVAIVEPEVLLADSEILTLHLSAPKGNTIRIGENEIGKMKRGAILINTARGQLIDEQALYRALCEGRLGGAALDVFPEEPYRGILCGLDNVVLTPHIATLTKESRVQMELEAALNLIRFLKGEKR